MSRHLISDPLARPAPGAELKRLRVEAGISVEDFARVYAGGRSVERIREIEAASWVHGKSAKAYRFVITGMLMVRSHMQTTK